MRSKMLTVAIAAGLGLTSVTATVSAQTSNKKVSVSASELSQMKAEIAALEQKVQDLESQQQAAQQAQVETAQAVQATQTQVQATDKLVHTTSKDKSILLGGTGGIKFTVGGFLAAESVYRSKNEAADVASSWNGIPYAQSHTAHTDEFAYSARQSRLSFLAQGDVSDTIHLAGYYEMDFLGGAQTANMNESNSFNIRQRHLYSTVDWDTYGLHLLAGQTWSLITLDGKGITPRSEVTPLTIDAQYVPGFTWARQTQLRIVKDWDKKWWLGFSVENPQTTFANGPNASKAAVVPIVNLGAGSGYDSVNTISLNHLPDMVVKFAADPGWGHYELFGLARDFYSRYQDTVGGTSYSNHDRWTTGYGLSMILPLVPKQLDFIFSGMSGKGIGRYGSAGLPDVTFANDGHTVPLKENMLLAGLTWHATPDLDVYAEGGREQQQRYVTSYGKTPATLVPGGWGNPAYVNSGCMIEGSPLACVGETRQIAQGTIGAWWKFYQGKFGKMQFGAQYSHTTRTSFEGVGGAAKTSDNMLFTSFRYYPF
ncbi:MAG: hypothetical protein ACTHNE_19615 [Dyella sp.]|uniref:hypothetical protein n=1 Tax=Dyella sp. TaxID=1869338 RepID=UPI003F8198E8